MKQAHRIQLLGRELQVRSSAPEEEVQEVAAFVNEKTQLENLSINTYVSTENLLPDYAGVSISSKLPASGNFTKIVIGGLSPTALTDNQGPKIGLFINDTTFVNGGITNESPFFLAILEDEHGINTASGIGHDIVGILDGDETNPYIMNDYYETELDDYTKGRVYFPYRNFY